MGKRLTAKSGEILRREMRLGWDYCVFYRAPLDMELGELLRAELRKQLIAEVEQSFTDGKEELKTIVILENHSADFYRAVVDGAASIDLATRGEIWSIRRLRIASV
jgi:hypothetical protein